MTAILVIMTVVLLGTTFYISTLLSSTSSPTQIQKTKAAAVTYSRKVDLFPTGVTVDPTSVVSPTVVVSPTKVPSSTNAPTLSPTVTNTPPPLPTKTPVILAQAPTLTPTVPPPTKTPSPTSISSPTQIPEPTIPPVTPTLQPLLAYKSTTISPTLIPVTNTGGMANPTSTPVPTKKAQPTGVQQLPETGWIQISSILFIVATSTILFSLLF
ncbi:MAG: hypothetical protein V1922_02805 [bacterium]